MSAQPQETPGGMWAPYEPLEIGEPLDALVEAGQFVLVKLTVRDNIKTEHGLRSAVDLTVQTTIKDATRLFSCFSAGIVGQAKRMVDGDLPAIVKVVDQNTPRGATRALELVGRLDPGADLAGLARSLPTPIGPVGGQTDAIPY
jgi:hypothetical protein